jgi:hypothetical protein
MRKEALFGSLVVLGAFAGLGIVPGLSGAG